MLKKVMGGPRSDVRGFTLIEVLLGLVIFSLISTGLYAAFGGSLRLEKKIRAVHAHCQDLRSAFEVVGKDIENAVPYPFDKQRSDRLAFEGHADRLAFFVPTDAGIMQVEYYAGAIDFGRRSEVRVRRVKSVRETAGGQQRAVEKKYFLKKALSLQDILAGKEGGGDVEAVVSSLADGGLKFRFGKLSADDPGLRKVVFQDDWKENALPDVVRVEVLLESSSGRGRDGAVRRDFYPVFKEISL